MAKVDLKSALRMVSMRPADWDLLGMFWKGSHYVNTCLPFGLRSAPCLFNHFADALHWVLARFPPRWGSRSGQVRLLTILVCEQLGIPVAFKKLEGPSTRITFLRIILDSEARKLSLPLSHKTSWRIPCNPG